MPRSKTIKRKVQTKSRYTKVTKPIVTDNTPETFTDLFTIAIMNYPNAKSKGIGIPTVAILSEYPYKIGVMCDGKLQFFYGFLNKDYHNRTTFKTIDGIWTLGKGWRMYYDEGVKEKN